MAMEQALIPYAGETAVLLGMYLGDNRYALRIGRVAHEVPTEWRLQEGLDSYAFRHWNIVVAKPITWQNATEPSFSLTLDDGRAVMSEAEVFMAGPEWRPAKWTLQDVLTTPCEGLLPLDFMLERHRAAIGLQRAKSYFNMVMAEARRKVIYESPAEQDKRRADEERRARSRRRGEPADGVYHRIRDEKGKLVFGLHDIEESADVRVIRVTLLRVEPGYYIDPPCPSSSPKVATNSQEVNIRVECHEEKTLFDLLYEVHDGQRLLDQLEAKLDHWLKRTSNLARYIDIHFAGLRLRETPALW
jgi:hypothetical protein